MLRTGCGRPAKPRVQAGPSAMTARPSQQHTMPLCAGSCPTAPGQPARPTCPASRAKQPEGTPGSEDAAPRTLAAGTAQ